MRMLPILCMLLCINAWAGEPVLWGTPYPLVLGKGGIRFFKSDTTTSCNAAAAGSVRYNAGNFEACNGSAWSTIGGGSGGTTYTANQYGVAVSSATNATVTIIAPDASTTKVLKSGGASANPAWTAPATPTQVVQTKVANYTAVITDDTVLASGAAFTVTLYAASGNTGKVLRIKKTDATLANIITIDANASETIDGALTTTLNTQYETVTIVCDGSNWHILRRYINSDWQASFAPTITEFGVVTSNSQKSRRQGNTLEVVGTFTIASNTSNPARIGIGYLAADDVTIDATAPFASAPPGFMGQLTVSDVEANKHGCLMPASNQTYFNTYVSYGSQSEQVAANSDQNAGAGAVIKYHCQFPIVGWKG